MKIPASLAGCASLVLLTACHSVASDEKLARDGSGTAEIGQDAGDEAGDGRKADANRDGPSPLADAALVTSGGCGIGPKPCCGPLLAVCADGRWLCQGGAPQVCTTDGGVEALPADDGGEGGTIDSASFFGCPDGCGPDAVCVILDSFRGDNRGVCQGVPAECHLDGGVADAGRPSCNACIGAALCSGVFGCFGTDAKTYACGI